MSASDVAILFNQILNRKIIRWPLALLLKKNLLKKKSYIRLALESITQGKRVLNLITLIAKSIINYLLNLIVKKYDIDKKDIIEIFKKEHYMIGLESVLKGSLYFGVNRPFTPGAPFLVVWDYTYRCNLRCKHCYINAGIPREELSLNDRIKALDILANAGVASIAYSGGEPLLGDGIFEIIKRTKDYGMHASMATNGTLITKDVAEKLAKIGLDYIQISLDSTNPQIHDEFRGVPGSFNRTIKGIKNVINAGITVEIAMTVTRYNINQVDKMLELAKDLGVPLFMHFNFIPTGRGKDIISMDIDPDTREDILKLFVKKANENFPVKAMSTAPQFARVSIQYSQQHSNETIIGGHFYQYKGDKRLISIAEFIGGCGAGRMYIALEPNGDIQPCVFLPIKVGNILKDDFEELWRNNKVFNDLRNRDLLEGNCGNCPFKYVCGGCRARAYAYFGDYLAPDPGCIYNRDLWQKLVTSIGSHIFPSILENKTALTQK